jgi:hypothetical protein
MKIQRDFTLRPDAERTWLCENTWCDLCAKADLGMTDPCEYEESGEVFVVAKCKACGTAVRSVIHERSVK